MARASAVDAIAGADRLTHVAFTAAAIVEAQSAGDAAVLGDRAADRLDDGHVLQAR